MRLVAIAISGAVLTACGGGAKAMSAHEYAHRVNAVCSHQPYRGDDMRHRSVDREIGQLTRKIRAVPLPSEDPKYAEAWLHAQDAERAAWTRFLATEGSTAKVDPIPRLEQTISRTYELAMEVGARVCAATGWKVQPSGGDTILLVAGDGGAIAIGGVQHP